MKSIDSLIPDIQLLFDKGVTLSDLAVDTFSKEIGTNLKEKFNEYAKERVSNLYLSNVGKPLRQLWFEISSGLKPEPLSASTKLKFLYGDLLEDLVLLLAMEAGHSVTRLQERVEVDGVRGKIDAVIDGWLVDVKSASSYSFSKFKDGEIRRNDPFGYIGQLCGYSRALNDMDAAFLAIDKTLGHLCLLKLTQEEIKSYDIHSRIKRVRETLNKSVPPDDYCYPVEPQGKSGNLKLGISCSYCNHKRNCYPELRTFIYSSGPVYLTKVTRVPEVFEAI